MAEQTVTSAQPTVRQLMADMPKAFHPERAAGEHAIIQYHLTGEGGGDWYLTIADGHCTVTEGISPEADVTLTLSASDFQDLGTGKISGMTAFMGGKIKATGSMPLAIKMNYWFART